MHLFSLSQVTIVYSARLLSENNGLIQATQITHVNNINLSSTQSQQYEGCHSIWHVEMSEYALYTWQSISPVKFKYTILCPGRLLVFK